MMHDERGPARAHKWLAWVVLGALSTIFAEVVSGADMFPFFHPWGLLVTTPLYTLHILVLGYVVFRAPRLNLSVLFLAGVIFGLYEAYITKMLWNPEWGALLKVAGAAPVEILVLAFWWHPWMSFITPLLVGEQVLGGGLEVLGALPGRLRGFFSRRRGFLTLAVLAGVFQSINSPSAGRSLAAGLASTGVVLLLVLLWRRITRDGRYSLRDLMPDRREFRWLLLLLLLQYLVLGILLRPEALPGSLGHAVIWFIYAGVGFCLWRNLSRAEGPAATAPVRARAGGFWVLMALLFTLTATLAELLLAPLAGWIAALSWLLGGMSGVVLSLRAGRDALRPVQASPPGQPRADPAAAAPQVAGGETTS